MTFNVMALASSPQVRLFVSSALFLRAVVSAGFDLTVDRNLTKKKLLNDLTRVAVLLGHAPTLKDFEHYGKYGTASYVRRFGSWNGALAAGGWETHLGRGIAVIAEDGNEYDSYGEAELANLLRDANRNGVIVSYTPKVPINQDRKWTSDFIVVLASGAACYFEYDGFGPKRPGGGYDKLIPKIASYKVQGLPLTIVSPHNYTPAYGVLTSLNELHQAFSGSDRTESKSPRKIRRKTRSILLDEIKRVAQRAGHVPSKCEFSKRSRYGAQQYLSIWGSWNAAVVAAGLIPILRRNIPNEELLEHLRCLSKRLGRSPRAEDLRSSEFSPATYYRRFGGMNPALIEAGLEINKASRACRQKRLC